MLSYLQRLYHTKVDRIPFREPLVSVKKQRSFNEGRGTGVVLVGCGRNGKVAPPLSSDARRSVRQNVLLRSNDKGKELGRMVEGQAGLVGGPGDGLKRMGQRKLRTRARRLTSCPV